MPWWVWGLLAWSLVALLLGVVLGRVLRAAERRELSRDREVDEPAPRERPWAS